MAIPKKTQQRLVSALKRYQPVLEQARARDVNESDTVTIVTDLLSDLFGYDKYAEVTSEYAIKNSFVDLAIKMEDKIQLLVEVKSIGTTLDDKHTKQAVDYAANQGVEWVALTNGVQWRVYKVLFGRPIEQQLVMDVNLLDLNTRTRSHLEVLWPLCRRGLLKSALDEYHETRQVVNRYVIAGILQQDDAVKLVRREIRRLNPDLNPDPEELLEIMRAEVIKRDVQDGDEAKEAMKRIHKASTRTLRKVTTGPPAEKSTDGAQYGAAPEATIDR